MLRPADDDYGRVVGRSHRIRVDVDSWLAGGLLAESIPLDSGTLTETGDQAVPEVLQLTVPLKDAQGNAWRPRESTDPLSHHGQRLYLLHNVIRGDDSILPVALGWYAIQDWDVSGAEVTVTANGLLQLLADKQLYTSTSPPAGATFASEIPRLVESLLPVSIDAALVDRAVPANMAWQDDRIDAIQQLLTAWPARMYVDDQGVLNVTTPYDDTEAAEVTLLEYGGTVVDSTDGGSRQSLPSVIVATGEDATSANRAPVVGYAADTNPSSPTFVGTYGEKTEKLSSPLLTTAAQAEKAARTRLATSKRQGRTIPVNTVPDARLRPGVRVDFQTADLVTGQGPLLRCRILSSVLQLTGDGGAQRLELGVIP